jgi:hypothetical protein
MGAVAREPRAVVTAFAVALAAAFAIVPLVRGGAEDARAGGEARLRIVDIDPLTVSGRAFQGGERVRVRVAAGALRRTRRVSAGGSGGFQLSFGSVEILCGGPVSVVARGSDGSRATLKLPGRRCPPAHDRGP